MYQQPAGDFEFGDVFSADWMFDAHVRGDAVPLKPFECDMGKKRPKVLGYQKAVPSPKRDLVLVHGQPHRAILLTENCEIESVIVRRGRGRLIFAAVENWPANPNEAERALNSPTFRRHPLPPADGFAGGVANLQSLFAVGRDAVVDATPDPRVTSLDDDAVIDLEIRWNAYATRRGPRAHLDNASKLAGLLTANGDADLLAEFRNAPLEGGPGAEALDRAAAALLAETLTIAWNLEGGVLNDMADALERGDRPDPARDEILAHLESLRDKAEEARRALTATRRPAS